MTDDDILRMQPAEIADVSAQLDALADRVDQMMAVERPNLSVQAGARDEVSQRIAATLNAVHDQFGTSVDLGTTDLRDTAATLRSQAEDVTHLDEGFAV
ncbi:PE family protein [Mycolicibacterium sp. P1-18]|uniref:PE family protein n=1 Tax=Mycolicibacterium sp. P1-18 TaxID=2024615 RepID=UPI0011F31592|nr:PE family protein [Mycolicibacterium sp. P1-18]